MRMQILVGGGRSSLHIVSSGTVCYPWTKSWSRLSACCPLARPNSSLGVSRNPFWKMPQINPTSLQPDLFCSSPTRVELDGASIRKVGMSRKLPPAQTRCLGHQVRVPALRVYIPRTSPKVLRGNPVEPQHPMPCHDSTSQLPCPQNCMPLYGSHHNPLWSVRFDAM